jgi:hypothetical protein
MWQCLELLWRSRAKPTRHRANPPPCGSKGTTILAMAAATTESEAEEAKPAIRLLRCWRLLDTTHVASVQWYRSLYTSFPELTRKGMFAEDCLSTRHMADSLGGEISFRSLV